MGLLSGLATIGGTLLRGLSTPTGLLAGTAVTGAAGATAANLLTGPVTQPPVAQTLGGAFGSGFNQAAQQAGFSQQQISQGALPNRQQLGASTGGAPFVAGAVDFVAPPGTQVLNRLTNGRVMVILPSGDVVTLTRDGRLVKPNKIIMGGERLPAGATIVAISADRGRIGITIRRRRRSFGAQLNQVRRVVRGAQAITRLCAPKTRRK